MNTKWTKLAVVAVVLSTSASSRAEQIEYSIADPVVTQSAAQNVRVATWPEVLGGDIAPLSVQAKSMNSTWRTFRLDGVLGDVTRSYYSNFDFGSFNIYYSQGNSLSINNENYLIAYRLKWPTGDSVSERLDEETLLKAMVLTPNSFLVLSLLNTRTAGNFQDIILFDSEKFAQVADESRLRVLRTQSVSHLKMLMMATLQWSQENNEMLPPMQNSAVLRKAIYPFLKSDTIFLQPQTQKPYATNVVLSRKSLEKIAAPSQVAALYEVNSDTDGKRAVAFADGHVQRVTEAEWTKIKKVSKIK